MREDTLKKANLLKQDIERLEKCVYFFSPMQENHYSRYDKELVESAKKRRFPFLFNGLFDGGKNKAQINYYGFFGGEQLEVDNEFIAMCQEYFKGKLEEKIEEFDKLN